MEELELHHQEHDQGAAPDDEEEDELVEPVAEVGLVQAELQGRALGLKVVVSLVDRGHRELKYTPRPL